MSTTKYKNRTPEITTNQPQDPSNSPTVADPSAEVLEKRPKLIDLSLTQVIGGSLAAATAAALGSRLGVAGTIAGAAVISVMSAVAGSIYTRSLRRARDGVLSAVSVVKERAGATGAEVTRTELVQLQPEGSDGTVIHDLVIDTDEQTATGAIPQVHEQTERTTTTVRPVRTREGLRPRAVIIGAVGVFVLTMAGIFGFELLTGHSLSGESGTTIEQITRQDPVTPQPADPGSGANDPSAEPSATQSAESTTSAPASPSTSAEATPSAPNSSSASPTSVSPTSAPVPAEPAEDAGGE